MTFDGKGLGQPGIRVPWKDAAERGSIAARASRPVAGRRPRRPPIALVVIVPIVLVVSLVRPS